MGNEKGLSTLNQRSTKQVKDNRQNMTTQISQDSIEKFYQLQRLDKNARKRADATTHSEIRAKVSQSSKTDLTSILSRSMVYIVLFAIGLIALYLSAEKQFMAASELFSAIMGKAETDSIRRSQFALLFFGEINAIFSMAIATSLPHHYLTIKTYKINISAALCYFWAFVSAMIAIVGNVTITINKYNALQGVAVLAWIETLVPPFAALYVGWTGERLWHVWSTALSNTKLWKADPTQHPEYRKRLYDNIIAELYKYAGNRELLENDRALKAMAYSVEMAEMTDNPEIIDVSMLMLNPQNSQN